MLKIRENRGFTLVELMIVVATIGILSSVAVPMYSNYTEKARVASVVLPTVHAVEIGIGTFYASHCDLDTASSLWPSSTTVASMLQDADSTCVGSPTMGAGGVVTFTLKTAATCKIHDIVRVYGTALTATPLTAGTGKISDWTLSGSFAEAVALR